MGSIVFFDAIRVKMCDEGTVRNMASKAIGASGLVLTQFDVERFNKASPRYQFTRKYLIYKSLLFN
jgi:hypothetical protein